ncbi:MAG: FecR family protein [Pseudomonadota bacterium]
MGRLSASKVWVSLLASVVWASATWASAPPAAVVDGVVMPAWLEREGQRQPIVPGMVLQERDRIETGANARILLTLPEGSKVKLGERAQLGFDALVARREGQDGSVFLKSVISVVTGAFRFTTDVLSKKRSRREVDIRLATVTAGIRGTDLWGKQGGAREIVCLLEGKIEVTRDPVAGQNTAPVILDQPMQFYIAPKGEPTLPIGRVPDAQLAQWAAETDIARDTGGASVGGRWKVRFDADTTFAGAMALYEDLRSQGYAAQFQPEKKAGKRIYVVQLANLSSAGDARALANRLGNGASAMPSVGRY